MVFIFCRVLFRIIKICTPATQSSRHGAMDTNVASYSLSRQRHGDVLMLARRHTAAGATTSVVCNQVNYRRAFTEGCRTWHVEALHTARWMNALANPLGIQSLSISSLSSSFSIFPCMWAFPGGRSWLWASNLRGGILCYLVCHRPDDAQCARKDIL